MVNQHPSQSIRGVRNFAIGQHPCPKIKFIFRENLKIFFRVVFFLFYNLGWKLHQVVAVSTTKKGLFTAKYDHSFSY